MEAERPGASHAPDGCLPNRVLLRELLWHLEQRECLLREEAWHLYLSRGAQGYRWPPPRSMPRPLMPSSERRQLERLCARVPPSHTAAVLSRSAQVISTLFKEENHFHKFQANPHHHFAYSLLLCAIEAPSKSLNDKPMSESWRLHLERQVRAKRRTK